MLRLLGLHDSKYDAGPDMAAAMERLIQANPSQRPGPDSMRLGQGVWEVRLAAALSESSEALGTNSERVHAVVIRVRKSPVVSCPQPHGCQCCCLLAN